MITSVNHQQLQNTERHVITQIEPYQSQPSLSQVNILEMMQAIWNQGTKNEEKDFPVCVGLQKINSDLPDLPCLL